MTRSEYKTWLTAQLAEIEPTIKRPASEREARIVTRAKAAAYSLGLYALADRLPERETKTPLDCCLRLRECLDFLDSPPASHDGPFSVAQAATRLGVSQEKVYKLCGDGLLPHTRIGRRITITAGQLSEFNAAHSY